MSEAIEENKEVKNEIPPTISPPVENTPEQANMEGYLPSMETVLPSEPTQKVGINKKEELTENQNNKKLLKDIIFPEKLEHEKKEEEQQQISEEPHKENQVVLNDIISTTPTTTTTQTQVINNITGDKDYTNLPRFFRVITTN